MWNISLILSIFILFFAYLLSSRQKSSEFEIILQPQEILEANDDLNKFERYQLRGTLKSQPFPKQYPAAQVLKTIAQTRFPRIFHNTPTTEWSALSKWNLNPEILLNDLPTHLPQVIQSSRPDIIYNNYKRPYGYYMVEEEYIQQKYLETYPTLDFFKPPINTSTSSSFYAFSHPVRADNVLKSLWADFMPRECFQVDNASGLIPATLLRSSSASSSSSSMTSPPEMLSDSTHLWLGYPGIRTTAHMDLNHNFFNQISGYKRFLISPPQVFKPYSRKNNKLKEGLTLHPHLHPSDRQCIRSSELPYCQSVHENTADDKHLEQQQQQQHANEEFIEAWIVDLKPGDMLYLPPFWLHDVVVLPPPLSSSREQTAQPLDSDSEEAFHHMSISANIWSGDYEIYASEQLFIYAKWITQQIIALAQAQQPSLSIPKLTMCFLYAFIDQVLDGLQVDELNTQRFSENSYGQADNDLLHVDAEGQAREFVQQYVLRRYDEAFGRNSCPAHVDGTCSRFQKSYCPKPICNEINMESVITRLMSASTTETSTIKAMKLFPELTKLSRISLDWPKSLHDDNHNDHIANTNKNTNEKEENHSYEQNTHDIPSITGIVLSDFVERVAYHVTGTKNTCPFIHCLGLA